VAGENTGSNLGTALWTNSKLALEDNVLSKWHEQGALYNESACSKFCSEIDSTRYEIKIIGNTYTKKEAQYIELLQLCIKFQSKLRLHTIAVIFPIFQPTWLTSKI
jgi:hypothetical protein